MVSDGAVVGQVAVNIKAILRSAAVPAVEEATGVDCQMVAKAVVSVTGFHRAGDHYIVIRCGNLASAPGGGIVPVTPGCRGGNGDSPALNKDQKHCRKG